MEKTPVITRAHIHRLCCEESRGNLLARTTSRARWELYLVVYNTTDPWPEHKWPVSRRHQVPTPAERTEALARLGYAPAPGATWGWQEDETPNYHGHPSAVSFLGSIDIVPLDQAQAAEGGES